MKKRFTEKRIIDVFKEANPYWIILRTAAMLGWPVPPAALEPGAEPETG